jgi:hypothetical protein
MGVVLITNVRIGNMCNEWFSGSGCIIHPFLSLKYDEGLIYVAVHCDDLL